jgi:hypothetical protein
LAARARRACFPEILAKFEHLLRNSRLEKEAPFIAILDLLPLFPQASAQLTIFQKKAKYPRADTM